MRMGNDFMYCAEETKKNSFCQSWMIKKLAQGISHGSARLRDGQ